MTETGFLFGNQQDLPQGASFALATETTQQFLTFQLHRGVYALRIELVREIRAVSAVSPLPGSPAYVRGIMNLRGAIVPVIDLRVRLGLPPAQEISRSAVTIITKTDNKSIGLIADAVHEVTRIPEDCIQKTSSLLEHGDQRFIQSLALVAPSHQNVDIAETLVVILNLDRLYDPTLETCTNSTTALYDNLHYPSSETSSSPTQTAQTASALSSEKDQFS